MRKMHKLCICSFLIACAIGITLPKNTDNVLAKDNKEDDISKAKRKPNIITIMLDDYGWSDSSAYGSKFYETPHMEEAAKEGIKFTNAYAGSSLCSPSRGMMMTGRYGTRTGVDRLCEEDQNAYAQNQNSQAMIPYKYPFDNESYTMHKEPTFLPNEEITIPEQLKKAGYTTAHIGKWHLGNPDYGKGPLDQGFDINIGGYYRGQPPTYFSPYNIPNLKNGPKGEYLTDRLADEAVNFIANHKDEPFFLNFSHYTVHTPIEAKQDIADKYRKKTPSNGQDNASYAAMIESADDSIGKVVQALKDNHLEEDTILVITSDNGGAHYWNITSNAPLKKGKCFNYEGGIRVPMIVSWKGHIAPGQINDTPVHQMDLFSTYSEAAGVALPNDRKIDGVSLFGLLTKGETLPERSLYWFNPHFNPDIGPYNSNPDKTHGEGDDVVVPSAAIRLGKYKLIKEFAPAPYAKSATYELYDLDADIGEEHNLAKEMPDRVKTMANNLDKWLYETNAVLPVKTSTHQEEAPDSNINQKEMKVKATSQATNYEAEKAIDGDVNTYWKTDSAGSQPQSLTLDLQKDHVIDRITYQPAKGVNNGNITQYKLFTSIDGISYDLQASGSWVNDASLKNIHFDSVKARYVKLQAIDAANGNASIAEINVYDNLSIQEVLPVQITTQTGMKAALPNEVQVLYSNQEKAYLPVVWEDQTIDYNIVGDYELQGKIKDKNIDVTALLHVEKAAEEANTKVNTFADFDGTKQDDKVLKGVDLKQLQDGFSYQFNIKLNGYNDLWQTLLEQYSDNNQGFRLDISPQGYVCFHVGDEVMTPSNPSFPWVAMKAKDKLPLHTWTQVRFAYSAKYQKARIYINGDIAAEQTLKQPISFLEQDLKIGSNNADYKVNGIMNNIKLYQAFLQETLREATSLTSISVNGTKLKNFSPDRTEYLYETDKGSQNLPIITAVAKDPMADIAISKLTAIPGVVEIDVTSTSGVHKKYKLHIIDKGTKQQGDFNFDNLVDVSDLGIATGLYGQKNEQFDMNGDGIINEYEIEYIMNQMLRD